VIFRLHDLTKHRVEPGQQQGNHLVTLNEPAPHQSARAAATNRSALRWGTPRFRWRGGATRRSCTPPSASGQPAVIGQGCGRHPLPPRRHPSPRLSGALHSDGMGLQLQKIAPFILRSQGGGSDGTHHAGQQLTPHPITVGLIAELLSGQLRPGGAWTPGALWPDW
jgi:hypothetical protein